jgi:tetratricopeptide (TPR) repeat protein
MTHIESANARTATRYLELAQASVDSGDWKRASDRAAQGLTYDDTISDLWFIRAYAEQQRSTPPYIVVPYVRSALESDQWIAYHRDAARLLYAGLLADTREPQKALALLDEAPPIQSLEADFIRAQSLYRIATPASREQGRALAQAVLRTAQMGPWKEQFILLFFRWEILPG